MKKEDAEVILKQLYRQKAIMDEITSLVDDYSVIYRDLLSFINYKYVCNSENEVK